MNAPHCCRYFSLHVGHCKIQISRKCHLTHQVTTPPCTRKEIKCLQQSPNSPQAQLKFYSVATHFEAAEDLNNVTLRVRVRAKAAVVATLSGSLATVASEIRCKRGSSELTIEEPGDNDGGPLQIPFTHIGVAHILPHALIQLKRRSPHFLLGRCTFNPQQPR